MWAILCIFVEDILITIISLPKGGENKITNSPFYGCNKFYSNFRGK